MKSITIITIVVVALLTAIIFGLTWLAYASCLKMYKREVSEGEHDESILDEYQEKKSIWRLIGIIFSYIVLFILIALFIIGFVYKVRGNNFIINNHTILVIKTGSMSDFYNDKRADEYNNDKSLQFDVGDICIFESSNFELKEGEVYGYKYNNSIITHRLITYDKEKGLCEFRGDNNNSVDTFIYGYIKDTNVLYHYTGHKIYGIGVFVLYAQSYFGIMSLVGIIGVAISSEIVYYKIDKINKERLSWWITIEVPKDEE